MKTLAEIYQRYAGADATCGCDKGTVHCYIDAYETMLAPYRRTSRRVLEIGIMGGHSLRMWEEYFEDAAVYGADLCEQPHGGLADLRPMIAERSHRIDLLNAADPAQAHARYGDLTFDVIIEDAGHSLEQQLAIYANFRERLTPDGIYVIEDVEDIDRSRAALERIDSERSVRILDLRATKGRFDDVLVVIRGGR